jgi:hypothetical protein
MMAVDYCPRLLHGADVNLAERENNDAAHHGDEYCWFMVNTKTNFWFASTIKVIPRQ